MRDALKSYLALAGGVTEVTRQRAVEAAKALVASGEAAAEQVTSLAEDLLTQTRQNREAVVSLVGFEVDRALGRVGLASADEVTALTERVRALESRLAQQAGSPSTTTGGEGAGTAGRGAAAAEPAAAPTKSAAKQKAPVKGNPAKAAAKATPAKATPGKAAAKTSSKAAKAPARKGGA